MPGNMADLLLLILYNVVILLLFTAFDRIFALPFLNPSRHEVRELLVAIEDLLLPMGSFPSKLLHPWAPTVENCRSNPPALPLSPKPTPAEGGSKPNATPAATESTPSESWSKTPAIPPSTEPTSGDRKSKLSVMFPSTEPTPDVGRSKSIATPHPTGPTHIDVGIKTATVPPLAEPIPDDVQSFGSEDYPDEPFFDSFEYQLASGDDTQIAESGVEVPLPEQQGSEIGSLHGGSIAVDDGEMHQEEDSTAVVEEVLTGIQAFEKAIRELVDHEGKYSPDLPNTIELVAGIVERQAEVEENLRSETVHFQRAEEDLRHGWQDTKEVFERIIGGQNVMLQLTRDKNYELSEENERLLSENDASKEKHQRIKDQYNSHLRTLNAAKKSAEEVAETATAGVQDRIDAVKERYENEKVAADRKNEQEQNTLICSRKMVEDSLVEARRLVTVGEQQHDAAMKDRNSIITGLKATVSQLRSTITTSEELATSAKRGLKKQLDDLRKEKDREIGTLKDQLRESKDKVKKLGGWKAKADAEQQNARRLSDRLKEETTTLREDKDHVVNGLKLDIGGLKRTIRTNEADINQLQGRVTGLESGEKVRDLRSQLGESQKKLQLSAKEKHDTKQQLQDQKREKEDLQDTIKARDKKIEEEVAKSSKEEEKLKKQLEQATRVPDRGLEEKARKQEEQKKELSRKLENAQETEQKARTEVQRLEDEKKRTTTGHQKAIQEKDEEIHRLGQTIEDAREAADAKMKEAEEASRLSAGEEQQHAEDKKEAVENAIKKAAEEKKEAVENAIQKAAEDAKNKERRYEKDKKEAVENAIKKAAEEKKEAVEKAIKEAAEDARQTHQNQLDDERKISREAQDKATKTENDLRTEIDVLKSQVEKVAGSNSADPANAQPGKDTKELAVLAAEANEANNLLLEIGRNGVIQGSVEHAAFHELNNAKLALYRVTRELRKPHAVADKDHLISMIHGVSIQEEHIQQLNITTQAVLVRQAKVANARLENVENILKTNDDVQKDAILEAIHARNPLNREIKKARGLKRHTQPGPGMLPSNSSTGVQAGNPMGQSQQTNGNPEQQYDPRLFNLHQNVQPQLPAATSQDKAKGVAPTHFGGATNGSASQNPAKATPDSTLAQGAPGSADDGSSSLMPRNQGDRRKGTPGFDFGAIDKSHPIWKDVNFSKQNEPSKEASTRQSATVPQASANAEPSSTRNAPSTGFRSDTPSLPIYNAQNSRSTDRSTEAKRDHRQSFADIMASLKLPASSDKATTAVVSAPVSKVINTLSTEPAALPEKIPQTFSAGEQSPLPGLQDTNGITVPVPPSQRPKNNMRGRGRINVSKGRQLAHNAFATRQTVTSPGSAQGQQSDPQEQVIDTQQEGSSGSSQQHHCTDQPKGWTDLITNAVMTELRKNRDVSLEFLGEFLRLNHDFETNDTQHLNEYLEKLRQEVKVERDHRSDQPRGWTAEMTGAVRDMLREGDDIIFIEENIKAQFEFQKNDTKCLEEWLKKLQSDYEAEVEDRMQQG